MNLMIFPAHEFNDKPHENQNGLEENQMLHFRQLKPVPEYDLQSK